MPGGWITAIFAGVLLSAYTTEEIGIALIFGAFVMGMVMPRHAGLTEDVTGRIEDFVVTCCCCRCSSPTPACARTSACSTARSCGCSPLVLIVVAIVGKFGGAVLAARVDGLRLARRRP